MTHTKLDVTGLSDMVGRGGGNHPKLADAIYGRSLRYNIAFKYSKSAIYKKFRVLIAKTNV